MSWFTFETLHYGIMYIQAIDIQAAWVNYEAAGYSRNDCLSTKLHTAWA